MPDTAPGPIDIVDAQVHIWEPDRPERPWVRDYDRAWDSFLFHSVAMTYERTIAAMDAVGVAAAVATPFLLYPDVAYELEAAADHPTRFAVAPQLDLRRDDPEEQLELLLGRPGVVAIRLALVPPPRGSRDAATSASYRRLREGALEEIFTTARAWRYPVMMSVAGHVAEAGAVAARHPDLQVIVDHFGVEQPPHRERPAAPFARLDELLALADLPNVALKLSGGPTLSDQPYPYRDLWPRLERILAAFGPRRLAWGSDFTRTRPLHTLAEAVGYLARAPRLSSAQKAAILGGTLRELLDWPPASPPAPHRPPA